MANSFPSMITKHGKAPAIQEKAMPMWPRPIAPRGEPDSAMTVIHPTDGSEVEQAFAARTFNFTGDFVLTLVSPGVVKVTLRSA